VDVPRLGGLALILGGVLLLVGFLLHPQPQEPGMDALARTITDSVGGVWYPVHVMLLFGFPIWMIGFLILYVVLVGGGERVYSLAAILSLGLATVFAVLGLVMEGFVEPVLAQRYILQTDGRESAATLLEYNTLLDRSIDAVTFFLLLVGLGLFGASLFRANLSRWLALLGIIVSIVGVVSYVAAIIGPYPYLIFTHTDISYAWVFDLVSTLIIVWFLIVGALLFMERIGPGRRYSPAS